MRGLYRVIWSPEGKVVCEVEAHTPGGACRKAPQPYRKYLGELYAEAVNPNAYVATITLWSEGFLLGGTKRHVSTPFASERDAIDFAKQSVEVNRGRPGHSKDDIRWDVVGVYADNPIPDSRKGSKS